MNAPPAENITGLPHEYSWSRVGPDEGREYNHNHNTMPLAPTMGARGARAGEVGDALDEQIGSPHQT